MKLLSLLTALILPGCITFTASYEGRTPGGNEWRVGAEVPLTKPDKAK